MASQNVVYMFYLICIALAEADLEGQQNCRQEESRL